MIEWRVPLFDARFGPEEEAAVVGVLRSGWLTMGDQVKRLEERFRAELDGAHVFAVTNCTAGLHMAFAAAGVGPGDEVIVPSMTFVATANAVRYCGATPIFADITSFDDPCIDPDEIERRITPKTRAIGVVHYAGFPCDMDRISAIAKAHGLAVVEDSAHSLFSSLNGVRCGVIGDISAFSFFSNKNMTCGEGGLVVTRRDDLAEPCRLLRSHGMTTATLDRHRGRAITYDVVKSGYNYRMDEIRAALSLAQLDRLPGFLAERTRLRQSYLAALTDIPDLGVPTFGCRSNDVGVHIMPVVLPAGVDRTAVIGRMRENKVQTSIHYPPAHGFSVFGDVPTLPKTEEFAARELTLPFFPGMTDEQLALTVSSLRQALQ